MKKGNIKISVGIPVHNEADNILFLLESIVKQKSANFILEYIYVICDGTSDGTDAKVVQFAKKYPFVKLVNDGKRKGKMRRLMELYRANTSDLFFVFDGDIVLSTSTVLEKMVTDFVSDDIAIVGANNQPVKATTFVGKLVNQWSHVWYLARLHFNNGDNIHNARGCGIALRKEFAKSITFPKDVVSDAQYIYFFCITQKLKFRFSKDAVILYHKPSTIYDYLLQSKRSIPEKERLTPIFGEWILEKYRVPKRYSIGALCECFLKNPILTILSGLFTIILQKIPYSKQEILWKRPTSTKKPISVTF